MIWPLLFDLRIMTTRSKVIDPYLMTLKLFDLKKLTFEILTSTQFVDLWNMTPFALRIWPLICDLGYWTWTTHLFMTLLVWPLIEDKKSFRLKKLTTEIWPYLFDLFFDDIYHLTSKVDLWFITSVLTSDWWYLSYDLKKLTSGVWH